MAVLPRDTYTRQPMIYRCRENGGFLLYSVGANRHDDGGVINSGKWQSEIKQPDWVWPHSPGH